MLYIFFPMLLCVHGLPLSVQQTIIFLKRIALVKRDLAPRRKVIVAVCFLEGQILGYICEISCASGWMFCILEVEER